jgi:hypothetical protein
LVGQASQRRPGHHQLHPSRPQHPGGPAVTLAEHDVLGTEVAVAAPLCLLPGQVKDPMSRLAEPAQHLALTGFGSLHVAALQALG